MDLSMNSLGDANSPVWAEMHRVCEYRQQVEGFRRSASRLGVMSLLVCVQVGGIFPLFPLLGMIVVLQIGQALVDWAINRRVKRTKSVDYRLVRKTGQLGVLVLIATGLVIVAMVVLPYFEQVLPFPKWLLRPVNHRVWLIMICGPALFYLIEIVPISNIFAVARYLERVGSVEQWSGALEQIERLSQEIEQMKDTNDENLITFPSMEPKWRIHFRGPLAIILNTETKDLGFATYETLQIVYHGTSFLGGRDRATVTWPGRVLSV